MCQNKRYALKIAICKKCAKSDHRSRKVNMFRACKLHLRAKKIKNPRTWDLSSPMWPQDRHRLNMEYLN